MLSRIARTLYVWRKTFLTRAARRYYSQFGEDALLDVLIDPRAPPGIYVDVGAWHPRKFSNTYFLYRRGWRGVNVDLDPIKIEAFNLARPGDINVCAAVSDERRRVTALSDGRYGLGSTIAAGRLPENGETGGAAPREVDTVTLDDILGATPYAGREIDLLSIDAEGHDFQVLRSIDLARYRPGIVVIECYAEAIDAILASPLYAHLTGRGYSLRGWAHLSLVFCLPDGALFRRTGRRHPQDR